MQRTPTSIFEMYGLLVLPLSKRGCLYCVLAAMTFMVTIALNCVIYTIAATAQIEWHAGDFSK